MTGYIVAGVIALFLTMQVVPLIRARRARGRSVPELDRVLNEAQRGQKRLLVYFWSPRCGMCRSMTPVIDRLAAERPDVVKIDAAEHTDLARQIGVMGTPSLAIVDQGVVQTLLVGARSEAQIRALLSA
jgi:thioredoxin 1